MRIKLFEEYQINRDLENLKDLLSDLDLKFEIVECDSKFNNLSKFKKMFPDPLSDAARRTVDLLGLSKFTMDLPNEFKFIEVFISGMVQDETSDFIDIVINKSKPICRLIDDRICLKPTVKYYEITRKNLTNEIDRLNNDLISELKNNQFISRIEKLTNYILMECAYVDIFNEADDEIDWQKWGIRLFLEHKD